MALAALGIAVAIYVAFSWLLARLWCRPKRLPTSKTPADYDLPFEAIRFSSHAIPIHGWFIPAAYTASPQPVVILAHGWSRNAAEMLPLARRLHEANLALLLLDARGHGASGGDGPVTILKFAEDILASLEYLQTRPDIDQDRVGVLGRSIGGSAAILAASMAPRLRAVVSCSAFADPKALTRDYLATWHLPAWLFAWPVFRFIERWLGTRLDSIAPQNRIGHITARLWRQVLAKMEAIRGLDDQFADPEGIAAKAQAEVAREEQEAQRQNESAALYAEAVRLLRAEQYLEALAKWSEVQALNPGYLDRHQVQLTAKKKLDALTTPARKPGWPRWALAVIGVLSVAAVLTVSALFGQGWITPPQPTPLPGGVVVPLDELANRRPWLPLDEAAKPGTMYYGFNLTKAPFDNRLVRQAFAAALDRQAIADLAMQFGAKNARPATTLIPPETLGRDLRGQVGIPFDQDLAKALLAEAGYPNGEGFPVVVFATNLGPSDSYVDVAALAIAMWRDHLNVTVRMENVDGLPAYLARLARDAPPIFRMDWIADGDNDPDIPHAGINCAFSKV
jgi:pimeloyl-ACP methyl ester carboxylesterase